MADNRGLWAFAILGGLLWATSRAGASPTGTVHVPLSDEAKKKIWHILGQWESSRKFDAILSSPTKLSYGYLQANYQAGMLTMLVQEYQQMGGQYAAQLMTWHNRGSPQLYKDNGFKNLLRKAAADPIMQKAQIQFFHRVFLEPAYRAAATAGWKLPISYLAVADAFLQLGEGQARKQVAAWATGPTEADQVRAFLVNRKQWLKTKYPADAYWQERIDDYINWLDTNPYLTDAVMVRGTRVA